jgi:hypothetical protein
MPAGYFLFLSGGKGNPGKAIELHCFVESGSAFGARIIWGRRFFPERIKNSKPKKILTRFWAGFTIS